MNRVIVKGYVMGSSSEIEGGKILGSIEYRENAFDFWLGPDELPGDFVQGSVVNDEAFSTITFW